MSDPWMMPNQLELIKDRSAEVVPAICHAGFTLADVMQLGVTPLAFRCNGGWKPVFKLCADKYGYCWEWVSDSPGQEYADWSGVVVLNKVDA